MKTTGNKQFLVVAVDYITKWVEAEPVSRITEKEIIHFIWKNLCCRFGLPRITISTMAGPQFKGEKIQEWCGEMKITQGFTVVAHPQANG